MQDYDTYLRNKKKEIAKHMFNDTTELPFSAAN